jgi:hypothetical protein
MSATPPSVTAWLALVSVVACHEPRAVVQKCAPTSPPTVATNGTHADSVDLTREHPLMGDKLVRYEKNPVIQGSDVSPDHSQAADPYLLVANGRLYVFFEAVRERNSPPNGCCGEIWMAESTDGFTWSGFRRVSSKSIHMSHPYAFVHQDQIHVLYNNNSSGGIFHRSSALSSFPDWSREAEIFRGSDHGWHHLVEFFTIEQAGLWYLIGITGDGTKEDQWIRGRWSKEWPADWNTGSEEMAPCPLLDIGNDGWVKGIVEITPVQVENDLFLLMGATRRTDGRRAIGTFAVSELSPASMKGRWLTEDHTFPLSASGWDDTNIHRAHAVKFKDHWVYAYDARQALGTWKIGVATAPLLMPSSMIGR